MAASLDIVERLRENAARFHPKDFLHEAADEIERLRSGTANRYWEGRWRDADAEIERLQAALDACADYGDKQVAEIEMLRERVAELQAQSGYMESIQTLEIERLRAALKEIADSGDFSSGSDRSDLVLSRDIARQALTGREGRDTP